MSIRLWSAACVSLNARRGTLHPHRTRTALACHLSRTSLRLFLFLADASSLAHCALSTPAWRRLGVVSSSSLTCPECSEQNLQNKPAIAFGARVPSCSSSAQAHSMAICAPSWRPRVWLACSVCLLRWPATSTLNLSWRAYAFPGFPRAF